MHHSSPTSVPLTLPGAARDGKRLAIVGHPNVGKSVIFHALTGKYVNVSNFPGTTVDLSIGRGKMGDVEWSVCDTPGVISLRARTDDERVARDYLLESEPDVILQVADAKNLSKAVHLTLELAEYHRPMVLALNMADEAQDRGITIDVKRLSALLGIPVVETVAINGEGLPELKAAIGEARLPVVAPRYDRALLESLQKIESNFTGEKNSHRAIAISLFNKDQTVWTHAASRAIAGRLGQLEADVAEAQNRFARPAELMLFESKQHVVQEIVGEVLAVRKPGGKTWLAKLGLWSMRPFPGYLIAALALYVMYQFVGVFGAGTLVGLMENKVFGQFLNPAFTKLVDVIVPFPIVREAIVGQYGIVTMALTYAFALILPIVTTFFLFFSFLEDSGYLPRLAVMMDRFFRLMGLNGRAVLPMVLGLGCDTMATVTTRIMDSKKEKIILSLLLTLAVPCSAQLGAILGMAAGMSWRVWIIWIGVVSGTMMLVGWAASRVIPGSRSPFLVELPPLRMPKAGNIAKKVKMRLKWYIKEVIPLFVLATFVLFVLDKLRLLTRVIELASPFVVSFLGLPARATEAFLIGFFRRDYGAAGFFQMAQAGLLNPRQVAVSMVVITLFMPCVAHLLITIKERGLKVAAWISAFVFAFALAVGGSLNWILSHTAFL